ncbi:MAG: hypothetical protein AB7N76_05210 [Planctomycetota bacterium]
MNDLSKLYLEQSGEDWALALEQLEAEERQSLKLGTTMRELAAVEL